MEVLRKEFSATGSGFRHTFSLDALANGIYMVRITTDGQQTIRKIIRQ